MSEAASFPGAFGGVPTSDGPLSAVATLRRFPAGLPEPSWVRCVEVRADLLGDLDPRLYRHGFGGDLLYSLRDTRAGGRCAESGDRRRARLTAAAAHYDYVDLDVDRDLHPDVLARVPPHRRVLSWYGPALGLDGLRSRFAALSTVDARLYRLAPRAKTMAQAFAPLLLLRALARRDVTAYARGPIASWTRVLAARFGAPVLFGAFPDEPPLPGAGEGEPPVRRLLTDYPPELVSGAERVYGILGAATGGSLSPFAHNTAYRSLGLPALFLPFSTGELPRSLGALRAGLDELGLPLHGVAVVAPHKEAAFTLAAEVTPSARRAGAASLLLRTPGGWRADTEADGILTSFASSGVEVAGREVAVIGCGGGGRAAAVGLERAGARVTLVNRDAGAGRRAAERLGLPFTPLREFDPRRYAVLVNATPVRNTAPFPAERTDPAVVIFDLTYGPRESALIAAARAAGRRAIDGRAVTLAELPRQFHEMTGRTIPPGIVRAAFREFGLGAYPSVAAGPRPAQAARFPIPGE